MKTIIVLLIAAIVCSCSTDNEPIVKRRYTFNITTIDNKTFVGIINWGVNRFEYGDKINGQSGYASSCRLTPDDVLEITIESKTPDFKIVFFEDSEMVKTVLVKPGQLNKFNYHLN